MATFVLVPGAWLGGWVWKDVAAPLRAAGHQVFPVTLTGLGERSHLARPEIDLETHIADVVNTIVWNDLRDVVLAGHSYAGTVVTGVADRLPDRLRDLVYVDSAPLADGQAMVDLYPSDTLAALQQAVDQFGSGWRWPFPGFEVLSENASLAGLGEPERAFMASKVADHPWPTYTQPLRLKTPAGNDPPYRRSVIACDDVRGLVAAGIPPIVALTRAPWRYLDLETGHWPMLSAPGALAEVLETIAGEG